MNKLADVLINIIKGFIALDLAALCLILFLNIMSRLFFHSLVWSIELANFLFVYLIFLGAIVSLYENRHFRVTLLLNILPTPLQKTAKTASNIVVLFILYMFIRHSIPLVVDNMGSTTTVLQIPQAFYYLLGIITGVPMFIIVLINTYSIFRGENTGVRKD